MKKRKLTLAFLCMLFASKSTFAQETQTDSTQTENNNYHSRKLKIEEMNFVTGYYVQNGNNAAVTGGIGDENLTDIATTFNISLAKYDEKDNKHSLNLEMGVDAYTSASSDKIDPSTISSASNADMRIYPSVNYLYQNDKNRYKVGAGYTMSSEYDYTSNGLNALFSKWSKDKNKEVTAKASVFLDQWKVIYPIELRPVGYGSGSEHGSGQIDTEDRNSYNFGIVYSQVINQNLQLALLADYGYQEGLLATRFHRTYFTDGSKKVENLPDTRTKIPVGLRASYFLGDNMVLRGFYRYYTDNWDVQAHTASLEVSYKITPFVSIAPSYRFYTQTQAEYFAPYSMHDPQSSYYTSDYDLSKFTSSLYGLNLRFANLNDKFFIDNLNSLDIRYGYYNRSTGLNAHSITFALNFK
ncbi:MAG: hypothetical protein C4K58_03095 [Flavobacteriaceae bacterium]|nr:MAG: hypothetical protein C4K58_03095 [Flavobacteriaceae bacterium]